MKLTHFSGVCKVMICRHKGTYLKAEAQQSVTFTISGMVGNDVSLRKLYSQH
jgi:hypothetical protein